jgi:hypothetical protein
MLTGLLVVLVAALAYIVHERLDIARFNAQALGTGRVNESDGAHE